MKAINYAKALGVALALSVSPGVWADNDHDTEGRIESINQQAASFVVNGMTIRPTTAPITTMTCAVFPT